MIGIQQSRESDQFSEICVFDINQLACIYLRAFLVNTCGLSRSAVIREELRIFVRVDNSVVF